MSLKAVRDLAARLSISANALAVLGVALEERVRNGSLDPVIKAEVDRVVAALGATEMLDETTPEELKAMVAGIRVTFFQGSSLLANVTSAPGWSHTEPDILQSIGEVSSAVPVLLKQAIVPRMEGLAKRLESQDAAFLDVGVGVGALAISMARLWPSVRVVGIDLWKPALAIAHDNVRAAGLATRIELREQRVQDLPDSDAFDLAWFPAFFIADDVIQTALLRVYRSLRRGGWIVLGLQNAGSDGLTASLARFRTVLWGGNPRSPADAEILLKETGFCEIQTVASPVIAAIVGRRQ